MAGTGSAGNTLNSFQVVIGLFVDSQGSIYLSDSANHRIMRWELNRTNAILAAGTGSIGADDRKLDMPHGIDVDEVNGYLYVVDSNSYWIQRYPFGESPKGKMVAGEGKAGVKAKQLKFPYAVCVSRTTGSVYDTDFGNRRIQRWGPTATSGVTLVTNISTSISLQGLMDMKLSLSDSYLFVSETSANRVWRFELN